MSYKNNKNKYTRTPHTAIFDIGERSSSTEFSLVPLIDTLESVISRPLGRKISE